MIDEKMIRAAATVHAKETWNNDEQVFFAMDGFKAGAQWAIETMCKQYIERMKALRCKGRR